MPDEKKREPDWLPSKEQWIAASAQNPDDFDEDGPNEDRLATEQEKARQTRQPD